MTKAGIGIIIAGAFVYFLASQTHVGWLYLFDAIIWSMLVMSAILPWYNLRSLRVERQVLLSASALRRSQLGGPLEDETIDVRLRVTNSGRLARYLIKVIEDCPFARAEERRRVFLLAGIGAGSVTDFTYTAICYRRGYYPAADVTLQSGGPLGLLVRKRTFNLPVNLTVYPGYYRMERLPAVESEWSDTGRAVRSSSAAEFYGSREYRHGDPLKHIHWRNTARVGSFMIKEFEQASQGPVAVAFETRGDFGTGRETTLEYSVRIAASLARLCADSERTIDILSGDSPLHNAGWREAMDYLARLEAGSGAAISVLTSAAEPAVGMVVIVPALEEEMVGTLRHLADRVRRLVVVLLEGFVPGETPHEFYSGLKGSNIEVIGCSSGNLKEVIRRLGSSLYGKITSAV